MLDRLARVVLIAVLCPLMAGCSPPAVASLLPLATGPLVTVTTRGGECANGPCGSTIVVERSGRVRQTAPVDADIGIVPANALAALDTAVRTTDFDTIRSRPFTGECPTAYDGQEVIYEFGAPAGLERIASCETEVDPDAPPFATVSAALVSASVPSP